MKYPYSRIEVCSQNLENQPLETKNPNREFCILHDVVYNEKPSPSYCFDEAVKHLIAK